MSSKKQKVFIMLSGGVDSSVAAALLKEGGFEVVGCHIKCYNVDGCGQKDSEDARRVAEKLRIPFYVFDLEKEYKEKVVQYMVDGYRRGITPNPDVMCNKEIKFGLFLRKALKLGADYVATGHYIRNVNRWSRGCFEKDGSARSNGEPSLISTIRVSLTRNTKLGWFPIHFSKQPYSTYFPDHHYSLEVAKDGNKDQSYFLWTLTQNQLRHCLFPIGDYTKDEVRKLAKEFGLLTANKKDSQGICFLGRVALADFLKDYIPVKKGAVLNVDGKKIGEHKGAYFYTIGQRHLDIKNEDLGIRGRNIKPHYVIAKDIKKNTITIAEDINGLLARMSLSEIKLANVNFITPAIVNNTKESSSEFKRTGHEANPMPQKSSNKNKLEIPVLVRVRYRQPLFGAKLIVWFSQDAQDATIKFDKPQKFIAPGQSAVFYDTKGKIMLGGGIIV